MLSVSTSPSNFSMKCIRQYFTLSKNDTTVANSLMLNIIEYVIKINDRTFKKFLIFNCVITLLQHFGNHGWRCNCYNI